MLNVQILTPPFWGAFCRCLRWASERLNTWTQMHSSIWTQGCWLQNSICHDVLKWWFPFYFSLLLGPRLVGDYSLCLAHIFSYSFDSFWKLFHVCMGPVAHDPGLANPETGRSVHSLKIALWIRLGEPESFRFFSNRISGDSFYLSLILSLSFRSRFASSNFSFYNLRNW